jgi:hypothetical protein
MHFLGARQILERAVHAIATLMQRRVKVGIDIRIYVKRPDHQTNWRRRCEMVQERDDASLCQVWHTDRQNGKLWGTATNLPPSLVTHYLLKPSWATVSKRLSLICRTLRGARDRVLVGLLAVLGVGLQTRRRR